MRFIAFDVLEQDTRTGSARHLKKNNLPVKHQGSARHWPDRSSQVQSHDSMMRRHWDLVYDTCMQRLPLYSRILASSASSSSSNSRLLAMYSSKAVWRAASSASRSGSCGGMAGSHYERLFRGFGCWSCQKLFGHVESGGASKRGWITRAAEAGNGRHANRSA